MDKISMEGLREAVQTGALRVVGVTAAAGLFFVTVQPRRGGGWAVLSTARKKAGEKQARVFRDPGKAIALLHGIGCRKIVVDVSRWEPARAGEEGWQRPDVSARQRRLHGVASQVAGLREAGG